MFVPKIRLFPLFYWFVNFTLTDKHGTKNLSGLIRTYQDLSYEDKPNSRYLSKLFSTTNVFTVENLWLFGMFSGDKGDNIDMRMIKITIKTNQFDMDLLLISKVDNIQKPCLSLKSGFFHYFIGL